MKQITHRVHVARKIILDPVQNFRRHFQAGLRRRLQNNLALLFVSPPSAHDFDTPEAKDFFSRYKAQYNSLPSSVWSVLAGDAFKVIVAALQAGTDANPEAVAKYLKKDLKEYPGLIGKLGFNEKGDRIGDLYKVYEVDGNGGFVLQK